MPRELVTPRLNEEPTPPPHDRAFEVHQPERKPILYRADGTPLVRKPGF